MKRYINAPMKKHITLAMTAAIFLVAPFYTKVQGQDRPQQPNIIFIMADDLGYGDLGCYGQQLIRTPNIDQLSAAGMRFSQAYAGGPVCTPSRSVLMTGLHNGHTPARDNIPHYDTYLVEEDITVAEILKEAGYRTGGVGKWSLGDAGTAGRATNQGFDFWLGYLNQDHAHYYYTEYLDYNEGKLNLTGNTLIRDRYSHHILTNGALDFIRNATTTPFFLYVAYTLPHFSSTLEDEHGLTVPSTEQFASKNWPEHAKKYASMLHMLDKDVGRIVQLIADLQLDNNTIIIFTSDNGGHSTVWEPFDTNGPLRGFKRDLTEGGIRVPFIVRWPGKVPAGTTNNEIITFQDMLPTFAALAGAKTPEKCDGISILPSLTGKKQKDQHPFLYWDYGHCRERYDQAVRMGKWKGIKLGVDSNIQLYDLQNDIAELNDIAGDYPDIVEQISKIMDTSVVADERYEVGNIYKGGPIWKKNSSY